MQQEGIQYQEVHKFLSSLFFLLGNRLSFILAVGIHKMKYIHHNHLCLNYMKIIHDKKN